LLRSKAFPLVTALALTASCSGKPEAAATRPANVPTSVVPIEVLVTGHKVSPRASVHKIGRGQTVRINVTSNVPDEVHVHGYEKVVTLSAGFGTTIEFVADKSGKFDVDMNKSHLKLLQLEVS
jgi:hypothetical protein